MLGKVVSENQRDWDGHVAYVLAGYNATEHSTTRYSPNMLVYGRELRFPNELMYTDVGNDGPSTVSSDDFVAERQELSKKSFEAARETLGNAAERSKRRYNMRVKPIAYEVGYWVYYFCPRHRVGRSPKWQNFYIGQFLVIENLGAVNLKIQKSARANAMVVHVDNIKHCAGVTPASWLGGVSSDNKNGRGIGTRPKRNVAIPARYLSRIYAVLLCISEVNTCERLNFDNNPDLSLCVISEVKTTTQRPSKLLFKCQTCDEEEDCDRAYTTLLRPRGPPSK